MSQETANAWPHLWNSPARERSLMRDTEDNLGTARCPLCRHVLVAVQGKQGPYFKCGCSEVKKVA